jgi:hypothetical protein
LERYSPGKTNLEMGAPSSLSGLEAVAVAFPIDIAEHSVMAFDLKEIIAARLGENYQLHEQHCESYAGWQRSG